MLEGDTLRAAVFYGVAQPMGEEMHLTRNGAQIIGASDSAPSFDNIGTVVVSPALSNSSASVAVRLGFELLVGRGTGGQGTSVSFAQVPSGGLVDEHGVVNSLAISFER